MSKTLQLTKNHFLSDEALAEFQKMVESIQFPGGLVRVYDQSNHSLIQAVVRFVDQRKFISNFFIEGPMTELQARRKAKDTDKFLEYSLEHNRKTIN